MGTQVRVAFLFIFVCTLSQAEPLLSGYFSHVDFNGSGEKYTKQPNYIDSDMSIQTVIGVRMACKLFGYAACTCCSE